MLFGRRHPQRQRATSMLESTCRELTTEPIYEDLVKDPKQENLDLKNNEAYNIFRLNNNCPC